MTNDLEKRLGEHKRGKKATISTKNRGPFKLVYYEKFEDGKTARNREKFFKSGEGRELRNQIIMGR